jgi:ABC-type multidrug transport system fused ATPase/permease subunit
VIRLKGSPNFRRVLLFLKPHTRILLIAQIAMLAATFAGLTFPWMMKNILDTLFERGNIRFLVLSIAALAFIFFLRESANYFKNYYLGKVGQHIIRDLRVAVFNKLQWISLSFYHNKKSGDIVSSMTHDIGLFESTLSVGITHFIEQMISLGAAVFLLVRIDATVTMGVFWYFPLLYFARS